MSVSRTSVTVLNELMQKKHLVTPHYSLLPAESIFGLFPLFKMQVRTFNTIGYGEGKTKKLAKHEAAKDALTKLGAVDYQHQRITTMDDINSGVDNNLRKKSVAILKYFTHESNLPMPVFEEKSVVGSPHQPIFTFECSVGNLKTTASESSKARAMQASASLMLEFLKELQSTINDNKLVKTPVETPVHRLTVEDMNYHKINMCPLLRGIMNRMREKRVSHNDLWENIPTICEDAVRHIFTVLEMNYDIYFLCKNNKTIASLLINCHPQFVICEISDTEANADKALTNSVYLILKLLQTIK